MFEIRLHMSTKEANKMRTLQREYLGLLVARMQKIAGYYKAKSARLHRVNKQLREENANLRAQLSKKKFASAVPVHLGHTITLSNAKSSS